MILKMSIGRGSWGIRKKTRKRNKVGESSPTLRKKTKEISVREWT